MAETGRTTNFPYGATNVAESAILGNYPANDPSRVHQYFNDFDGFTAADWTVVETQAGATQAIAAGDGGLVALVNSAALNDVNGIALATATFLPVVGKKFWMKARLKVDSGALSDLMFGLVDVLTAFNPGSGLYLSRTATGATVNIEKATVLTSSTPVVKTIADDTFFELGLTYEPGKGVKGWLNGGSLGVVNTLTNWPAVNLTPGIMLRNNTAAARTMTVDYILAAVER